MDNKKIHLYIFGIELRKLKTPKNPNGSGYSESEFRRKNEYE
jgi:hypothetical protein